MSQILARATTAEIREMVWRAMEVQGVARLPGSAGWPEFPRPRGIVHEALAADQIVEAPVLGRLLARD